MNTPVLTPSFVPSGATATTADGTTHPVHTHFSKGCGIALWWADLPEGAKVTLTYPNGEVEDAVVGRGGELYPA